MGEWGLQPRRIAAARDNLTALPMIAAETRPSLVSTEDIRSIIDICDLHF